MASVMPKVKTYLWLSIICLMFNMCVCVSSVIVNGSQNPNDFLDATDEDEFGFEGELPDNTNATITNFILASGTSFIPFFSLKSLTFTGVSLPDVFLIFSGLIIGIIGIVQVFLITVIILNLAPKFVGSGFDV